MVKAELPEPQLFTACRSEWQVEYRVNGRGYEGR